MAPSTSPTSEADPFPDDGWPWACLECGRTVFRDSDYCRDCKSWPWPCLDCGRTIFHDSDYCRDCTSARASSGSTGRLHTSPEFSEWMRRESYPTFVLKTTVIAGAEVALTALWLHVSLVDPGELMRHGLLFV